MNDHENCDLCGGIMRAGMEINPVSYVCVACGHTVYGCMDPALPEPSGEALQRVEVCVVFAGETPTMDELKRLRKLSRELRWVPVSTLLEKLKNTRTWPLGIVRRHETGLLLEQVAASGLHAEVFPHRRCCHRRRAVVCCVMEFLRSAAFPSFSSTILLHNNIDIRAMIPIFGTPFFSAILGHFSES